MKRRDIHKEDPVQQFLFLCRVREVEDVVGIVNPGEVQQDAGALQQDMSICEHAIPTKELTYLPDVHRSLSLDSIHECRDPS
jgi:hypothetical protein